MAVSFSKDFLMEFEEFKIDVHILIRIFQFEEESNIFLTTSQPAMSQSIQYLQD